MITSYLKKKAVERGYVIASYFTLNYGWTARLVRMDLDEYERFYLSRGLDRFVAMTFGTTETMAVYAAYKQIDDIVERSLTPNAKELAKQPKGSFAKLLLKFRNFVSRFNN